LGDGEHGDAAWHRIGALRLLSHGRSWPLLGRLPGT
jgi:hypothetical protein